VLTNQEGDGWQRLGEGLMPSPEKSAGAMMEGFDKIGDQLLHGVLGGTSLPDFHNALGAMYGPDQVSLSAGGKHLPGLELFDSGAGHQVSLGDSLKAPGADSIGKLADSPLSNVGKAFTDIMSKMGDMLGAAVQGPMGLLGGLLNFLLTVFSQIISSVGQIMEQTAQSAATLASDLWKKQLGLNT